MNQNIIILDSADNFDKILKDNQVVLVDFLAEWCGPCKKLSPTLEQKANEGLFVLLKVDVDDFGDIAEKYDVSGIPHVILFKNGKKVDELVGFNLEALDKMILKI
jgi:thioredoxin 1